MGPLRETIVEFVTEVGAAAVLLGKPRPGYDAMLSAVAIQQLVTGLRAELDVSIEIVASDGPTPQPGR